MRKRTNGHDNLFWKDEPPVPQVFATASAARDYALGEGLAVKRVKGYDAAER
jgi:hypothetical protein